MPLKLESSSNSFALTGIVNRQIHYFFRESNPGLCSIFSMKECNVIILDVKTKGSKVPGEYG